MKQILLICTLTASAFLGFAQPAVFETTTADAEIEIWIKGARPGMVRLYGVWGNQNLLKDSAVSDASAKVVFRNKGRYLPGFYYAVHDGNKDFLGFLVDKNQRFFIHADKADVINTVKTNSAENKLFFESQVYEAELSKKIETLNAPLKEAKAGTSGYDSLIRQRNILIGDKEKKVKEYLEKHPGSFFASFKYMGQNPKLKEPKKPNGDLDTASQLMHYREQFWDNYDFKDERMVRTPVYFNKLNTYLTGLFPQRVDSIMKGVKFILDKADRGSKEVFNFTVNYILMTYYESTVMGGEKIYCYAVDNYFTRKKAFWTDTVNIMRAQYESDIRKGSLLGETGQDLRCRNENGEYVNLYSLSARVKVIYLYNPDCEHCMKETPKLKALYDKWKPKGLEVFALNVEHDDKKWLEYIKKLDLNWVNVHDNTYESKYHKKYHMKQTPGLYVLDAFNKIVAKQIMPEQLEPTLEYYLK